MRLPNLPGIVVPAWAQALSFGAVAVAGLVLGHGVAPHKVLHQEGTSLTISITGSMTGQPDTSAGHSAASQFQRARVAVVGAGSLKLTAAGRLGRGDVLVVRVPAGAYAVCVLPPDEWRPAGATASGPAGWACTEVTIGTRSAVAELTFTAAAHKRGGGQK